MKYYLTIGRNAKLMNTENTVLSETCQAQMIKYYIILLFWGVGQCRDLNPVKLYH